MRERHNAIDAGSKEIMVEVMKKALDFDGKRNQNRVHFNLFGRGIFFFF